MRQHAAKTHVFGVQYPCHVEQCRSVGPDSGSVTVRIDLNQNLEVFVMLAGEGGDGGCRFRVVRNNFEVAPLAYQRQCPPELGGHHPHRI